MEKIIFLDAIALNSDLLKPTPLIAADAIPDRFEPGRDRRKPRSFSTRKVAGSPI